MKIAQKTLKIAKNCQKSRPRFSGGTDWKQILSKNSTLKIVMRPAYSKKQMEEAIQTTIVVCLDRNSFCLGGQQIWNERVSTLVYLFLHQ